MACAGLFALFIPFPPGDFQKTPKQNFPSNFFTVLVGARPIFGPRAHRDCKKIDRMGVIFFNASVQARAFWFTGAPALKKTTPGPGTSFPFFRGASQQTQAGRRWARGERSGWGLSHPPPPNPLTFTSLSRSQNFFPHFWGPPPGGEGSLQGTCLARLGSRGYPTLADKAS